jgi:glycosyltransferase involved in cell wall biosynthesis
MSSKIRLLYITQSYGGVEIYIRQIINLLDYSCFELIIAAPKNESFESFCQDNNIPFYTIKMGREFNLHRDIGAFFQIKKIIKKTNPDIVHLHSSKAGFIGRMVTKLLKKKSVFTPHGISYMPFKGRKRVLFFLFEVFAKNFTYRILGCSYSESLKMNIEVGISKQRINTLLNAIPIQELDINKKRSFSNKDKIQIGTIARLTYQKNPLLFVEIAYSVLQKYPNVEFSILGAGLNDHLKKETISMIGTYGIADKFKIIEWGSQDMSIKYLKSLDIFILPSIFEGLPLSLLEAMSYGIPCITSKCDGCNDVIHNNENGFSCMTVKEYTETILKLINDESLQRKIRFNGYEYVREKHHIDIFINKMEIYYKKIHNES